MISTQFRCQHKILVSTQFLCQHKILVSTQNFGISLGLMLIQSFGISFGFDVDPKFWSQPRFDQNIKFWSQPRGQKYLDQKRQHQITQNKTLQKSHKIHSTLQLRNLGPNKTPRRTTRCIPPKTTEKDPRNQIADHHHKQETI